MRPLLLHITCATRGGAEALPSVSTDWHTTGVVSPIGTLVELALQTRPHLYITRHAYSDYEGYRGASKTDTANYSSIRPTSYMCAIR